MSLQDLRSFVHVDETDLWGEWRDHPHRYLDAIEAWSEAEAQVERIENALKEKRAEVAVAVRNAPEMYDLDKVTESGVMAAVDSCEPVQQLKSSLILSRKQSRDIKGIVDALESKRKALEHLTELDARRNQRSEPHHHDAIGARLNRR
jgi:hypothetical protein